MTFAGNTSFDAENCAIYSNSSAGAGLIVQGSASVVAAGFCSAGGVSTPAGLTPTPQTGCPRVDDPFASVPGLVPALTCKPDPDVKPKEKVTLSEGTYCGLTIKGTVTLNPGKYIIKGPAHHQQHGDSDGVGCAALSHRERHEFHH